MEDDVLELKLFRSGGTKVDARIFPATQVLTIGRASDCIICLDEPLVGIRHAVLYLNAGRCVIGNEDGRSVIVVNGAPTKLAIITAEDDVRVGSVRLEVRHVPAAESFTPVDADLERTEEEVRPTTPPVARAGVLIPPPAPAQAPSYSVRSSTRPDPVLEVVHYRYGALIGTHELSLGARFTAPGPSGEAVELVRVDAHGGVRVCFDPSFGGYIARERSSESIASLCASAQPDEDGRFGAGLSEGDYAHLELGKEAYFVRFAHAPVPAPVQWALGFPRIDESRTPGP